MKPVTLWYKIDAKGTSNFNHLEDGHATTECPAPKCANQAVMWNKPGLFRKEHAFLNDTNKVLRLNPSLVEAYKECGMIEVCLAGTTEGYYLYMMSLPVTLSLIGLLEVGVISEPALKLFIEEYLPFQFKEGVVNVRISYFLSVLCVAMRLCKQWEGYMMEFVRDLSELDMAEVAPAVRLAKHIHGMMDPG